VNKLDVNSEPISQMVWRNRSDLTANHYNPNRVASPEMELLKISILENGWTQPIVINSAGEIVDGFHRWLVSGDPDLMEKYGGYVPCVTIPGVDLTTQMMATIRHNRARGTHGVIDMANIIQVMIDSGTGIEEIMARLGMEREEVVRLGQRVGIPHSEIIKGSKFSKSWEV
jgi:ParB-like chromosome segregation protein Spo0J